MTITLIRNPLRAAMDRKTVTHSLCGSQMLLWSGRALLWKRGNLNPRHQRKINDLRTPLHMHNVKQRLCLQLLRT